MSQTQRLRPRTPNPHRYQGGRRHYHVSPPRSEVPWEHWIGEKSRGTHRRFWAATVAFVIAITAISAALWH
jgi:hypothetical protein